MNDTGGDFVIESVTISREFLKLDTDVNGTEGLRWKVDELAGEDSGDWEIAFREHNDDSDGPPTKHFQEMASNRAGSPQRYKDSTSPSNRQRFAQSGRTSEHEDSWDKERGHEKMKGKPHTEATNVEVVREDESGEESDGVEAHNAEKDLSAGLSEGKLDSKMDICGQDEEHMKSDQSGNDVCDGNEQAASERELESGAHYAGGFKDDVKGVENLGDLQDALSEKDVQERTTVTLQTEDVQSGSNELDEPFMDEVDNEKEDQDEESTFVAVSEQHQELQMEQGQALDVEQQHLVTAEESGDIRDKSLPRGYTETDDDKQMERQQNDEAESAQEQSDENCREEDIESEEALSYAANDPQYRDEHGHDENRENGEGPRENRDRLGEGGQDGNRQDEEGSNEEHMLDEHGQHQGRLSGEDRQDEHGVGEHSVHGVGEHSVHGDIVLSNEDRLDGHGVDEHSVHGDSLNQRMRDEDDPEGDGEHLFGQGEVRPDQERQIVQMQGVDVSDENVQDEHIHDEIRAGQESQDEHRPDADVLDSMVEGRGSERGQGEHSIDVHRGEEQSLKKHVQVEHPQDGERQDDHRHDDLSQHERGVDIGNIEGSDRDVADTSGAEVQLYTEQESEDHEARQEIDDHIIHGDDDRSANDILGDPEPAFVPHNPSDSSRESSHEHQTHEHQTTPIVSSIATLDRSKSGSESPCASIGQIPSNVEALQHFVPSSTSRQALDDCIALNSRESGEIQGDSAEEDAWEQHVQDDSVLSSSQGVGGAAQDFHGSDTGAQDGHIIDASASQHSPNDQSAHVRASPARTRPSSALAAYNERQAHVTRRARPQTAVPLTIGAHHHAEVRQSAAPGGDDRTIYRGRPEGASHSSINTHTSSEAINLADPALAREGGTPKLDKLRRSLRSPSAASSSVSKIATGSESMFATSDLGMTLWAGTSEGDMNRILACWNERDVDRVRAATGLSHIDAVAVLNIFEWDVARAVNAYTNDPAQVYFHASARFSPIRDDASARVASFRKVLGRGDSLFLSDPLHAIRRQKKHRPASFAPKQLIHVQGPHEQDHVTATHRPGTAETLHGGNRRPTTAETLHGGSRRPTTSETVHGGNRNVGGKMRIRRVVENLSISEIQRVWRGHRARIFFRLVSLLNDVSSRVTIAFHTLRSSRSNGRVVAADFSALSQSYRDALHNAAKLGGPLRVQAAKSLAGWEVRYLAYLEALHARVHSESRGEGALLAAVRQERTLLASAPAPKVSASIGVGVRDTCGVLQQDVRVGRMGNRTVVGAGQVKEKRRARNQGMYAKKSLYSDMMITYTTTPIEIVQMMAEAKRRTSVAGDSIISSKRPDSAMSSVAFEPSWDAANGTNLQRPPSRPSSRFEPTRSGLGTSLQRPASRGSQASCLTGWYDAWTGNADARRSTTYIDPLVLNGRVRRPAI